MPSLPGNHGTTTVRVLEHAGPETPGLIADALAERGVRLETVRPFDGDVVPAHMDGCAGLVLMGGPMGVYESGRYPYLRDEIALAERALAEDKPVLGICLGSQILAAALGARVAPGRKEIGWLDVSLTPDASSDPLWGDAERRFAAFHWHGDAFDLPRGAVSLAFSQGTPHQAFRHGANAYGILFHMEVTGPMVRGMVDSFPDELTSAGADGAAILASAPTLLPPMHRIARTVFGRWARLLAPQPA